MSRTHIDHRDLMQFAEDKVNLPKDKADEYRAQARRLRELSAVGCWAIGLSTALGMTVSRQPTRPRRIADSR